jgi:hypothetical protein
MLKALHIEIISDGRQSLCQSECSTDWSQPEVQTRAKIDLQERFGDRIRLDYVDIRDSDKRDSKETSYPFLIIDGHIRLSGQFDMRQLMEIVETQLEIGATAR